MAYLVITFKPPWMHEFPIKITWNEGETLPTGITFIKRDPKGPPMKIELTVESAVKFHMVKTNIKRCELDCKALMEFGKFTKEQVEKCVTYVRNYVDRIDIVVTDTGVNEYKITLPTLPVEWNLIDVQVNGKHIDFTRVNNQIEFTVTHGSPEETISLILQSTTTQTIATTTNLLVTIVALFLIITLLRQIITVMRR